MKINIGEDVRRQDSGKHKFLNRLAKEFEKQGASIVNGKSDIFLHIGRNMEISRAHKVVMRIDGLILNKEQPFEKINRKIVKHINGSNAIIYQGNFCKEAFVKFLGIDKEHAIIPNGADPKEFLPRDPENFFLTYCNWRPHKRLKNTCEGFIRAVEKGLDSKLIVAGKVKKPIKHKQIEYIGWVKPSNLKKMLSNAIATVHLSWLDWCPNSMVESIVAGCPVIYSSSAGCGELGSGSGISINDIQWDFKPTKLYKPPHLDCDEIADAMLELKKNNLLLSERKDLYIENIAKKYLDFFQRILG